METIGQLHALAACFTVEEKGAGTKWVDSREGPRASLDTMQERKTYCPC
jgi:hypothetical protein